MTGVRSLKPHYEVGNKLALFPHGGVGVINVTVVVVRISIGGGHFVCHYSHGKMPGPDVLPAIFKPEKISARSLGEAPGSARRRLRAESYSLPLLETIGTSGSGLGAGLSLASVPLERRNPNARRGSAGNWR